MEKNLAEELLEIKEEIDNRKTKKSELDGALKSHYQRLKEDFNCTTLDEAKEYITELSDERDEIKLQLEKGIEEIKLQMGE
jgi:hypothetical protein